MTEDSLWIDQPAALESLCRDLSTSPWIALDTEFLRERSYYPQLCLVQVATPQTLACVDALALPSLAPLLALLDDAGILKVLHAARQDLELFFHLSGRVPAPVFDTQIAASFAGFSDQAGYATVVAQLLGVRLDKIHTRTDWSRRPLPAGAIRYAADDVRYLCQVYQRLRGTLEQSGRLAWVETECRALSDPAAYRPDPDTAWQRLKGVARLKPRQIAAARVLAAWRERTAMADNLPRQWVLRDEALLDILRRLPLTLETLGAVRGLSEHFLRRHGQRIVQLLAEVQASAVEETKAAAGLAPGTQALAEALGAVVRLRAAQAGVNAAQLASRSELEALALGRRDLPVLHGWRLEIIGQDLLRVLAGELALVAENGNLKLVASGNPKRR